MKRIAFLIVASAAFAAALTSCDSKEKKVPFEMVDPAAIGQASVVHGIITAVGDGKLEVKPENSERKTYDISDVVNTSYCIGRLHIGDKVAVELADDNSVRSIINETQLVGRWVEPSPVDEGNYQGIELEESGAATSINLRTIIYRTWMLQGGKIVLYYVTEGRENSSETEHDAFNIQRLTSDSLILKGRDVKLVYRKQLPDEIKKTESFEYVNDDTQDYNVLIEGM